MKVVQVLPALELGGVERGTLEIAKALVKTVTSQWLFLPGGVWLLSLKPRVHAT